MTSPSSFEDRLTEAFRSTAAPASMARWRTAAARPQRSSGVRPIAGVLAVAFAAAGAGGFFGLRAVVGGAGGNAGSPAARAGAAMAYDDATHTVVLFGGEGSSGDLSDTWTWDGSAWTQLHPTTAPTPRRDAAMAYDPVSHDLLLYGGHSGDAGWSGYAPQGGEPNGILSDTWAWDGTGWARIASKGPVLTLSRPLMATDPVTAHVVLVSDAAEIPNAAEPRLWPNTWVWGGSGWLTTTATAPTANQHSGSTLVPDMRSHHLQLFTLAWPTATACASATAQGPARVLPGGSGVLVPTVATPRATPGAGAASTAPGQATGVSVSASPACGGQAPSSASSAALMTATVHVSTWTGASWSAPTTHAPGPLTVSSAAAPLPSGGVLFNEPFAGTQRSTTVVWDGTWQGPSFGQPPSMLDAAIVYDPATDEVVLFGGASGYQGMRTLGYFNETWTWSGGSWRLRGGSPPPTPSPAVFQDSGVTSQGPGGAPATGCIAGWSEQRSGSDTRITVYVTAPPHTACPGSVSISGSEAVRGSPASLSPGGGTFTFVWSNWCGGAAGITIALGGHANPYMPTTAQLPPACVNRTLPSLLARG